MTTVESESPLRHMVHVARLPAKGMNVRIQGDPNQLKALARDHGLVAVDGFHAHLLVAPWKKDGVKVTGKVTADIVQDCVVTLETLSNRLETDLEATFVPRGSRLARPVEQPDGEMVLDAEGPDLPEEFSGQEIDVGFLAEEHFALAIDPYPRSPAAGRADYSTGDGAEEKGPLYEKLKSLREGP